MARRLFTIAPVSSLLFCLAVATLWLRSRSGSDEVFIVRGMRSWALVSYHGGIYLEYVHWRWVRPIWPDCVDHWWGSDHLVFREAKVIDYQEALLHVGDDTLYGIPINGHWDDPQTAVHGDLAELMVHDLLLLPLLLLLPGWMTWKSLWKRQRSNSNQCTHCGYDLRASKERCPECGTPISQKMGVAE
jgi:hypothetical protein